MSQAMRLLCFSPRPQKHARLAMVVLLTTGIAGCAVPRRSISSLVSVERTRHRAPAPKGNESTLSFQSAKQRLEHLLAEAQQEVTFYCGCTYRVRGISPSTGHLETRTAIDRRSCGYAPRRVNERAERLEWEHVVPAYAFGHRRAAWIEGHADCGSRRGRKCARKVDDVFRRMEADMHNLVPAIGELNGDRANHPMGIVRGESRRYGRCDFEVEGGVVEPTESIRGDIARIYLYMHDTYPGTDVLQGRKMMFDAWSEADPPDAWECAREKLIAAEQGNRNSVVRTACE